MGGAQVDSLEIVVFNRKCEPDLKNCAEIIAFVGLAHKRVEPANVFLLCNCYRCTFVLRINKKHLN